MCPIGASPRSFRTSCVLSDTEISPPLPRKKVAERDIDGGKDLVHTCCNIFCFLVAALQTMRLCRWWGATTGSPLLSREAGFRWWGSTRKMERNEAK